MSLNTELLHSKHILKIYNIHSVRGFSDSLLFNTFLSAFIPDSLSIDGNMFTTLRLTKTEFSGKLEPFKLSLMSKMWLLSLILDGILSFSLYKTFSTNIDQFSTAVLQPLVIILTRLLAF